MLSHSRIWAAIDRLAARHGMTPSGLARRAGLDPTTFNRSKRAADGRQRWPSTESIAKILAATGVEIDDFVGLLRSDRLSVRPGRALPVLGFAQAGDGGFAIDVGPGSDQVEFPATIGEQGFALRVRGDSMLPLYRNGDIIIVARDAPCRKGDRVVVKTRTGEVMAKVLQKKTARAVDLASLNPDHPNRTVSHADIEWMARIMWASQ
jgi:phage repressor protein C with HTH and peptisase S24 domain